MANAVIPQWHGHNYQARVFWQNAFNVLASGSCVVEVSFEADGPKAFDDVVVRYNPPVTGSGQERVPADYHQVKWHVEYGGRFGYRDIVDPAFIGAKSASLLERLQKARTTAPDGSRFTLITTHRILDGDPLGMLMSGHDKTLLVEKLFDGTTDRSRMGKVRKLWREHLKLESNVELRSIVTGLRILDSYLSLEELREDVNRRAREAGLLVCPASNSDFRYDELARQLKVRGLNTLTRDSLEQLSREEGLVVGDPPEKDRFLNVAIRSFLGPAADIVGAAPGNTLLLTDAFRQRYLRDDLDWQDNIRPRVEKFLLDAARRSPHMRLILDAHASVAFLAGCVLDLKSGVVMELVQKGRVGTRTWRPDDGSAEHGTPFEVSNDRIGCGEEIAAAVSISQPTKPQARDYIRARLPNVGKLVSLNPQNGPGQQSIAGGQHACVLAEQASNVLREVKGENPDCRVHIFAACPNSFLFYLGQQHQGISPCIVYEFDYDRKQHKTYQPSFIID